jgi:Mannosyltransferase (PIG-V)
MYIQKLRTACKEAAWVFGLSRLMIILISFISIFLLPRFIPFYKQLLASDEPYKVDPYGLKAFFFSWFRWDVKAYVNISMQGYKHTPDVAFFPLWPLIQRCGSLLLGSIWPGSYYLAGLLIANMCFYIALVLFYCLLAEDFESGLARRALIYLSFGPFALFYFAGYSESLFLLLCIACFLFLRRGKPLDWWLAGFLGFLATLTRSAGLMLAVPFLCVYLQRFWLSPEKEEYTMIQKLNALMPIMLLPIGIIVYMVYLYYTKGDPFIFQTEEAIVWQRHFSLPWNTLGMMVVAIFTSPSIIILGLNVIDNSFALLPLVVLGFGWKRIPLHYALFALALAVFSMSFPATDIVPMISQPRLTIVFFPICVILAVWGKNRCFNMLYLSLALTFLIINIIMFIGNIWVA